MGAVIGFAVGALIGWFIVVPVMKMTAHAWDWPRAAAVGTMVGIGALAIVVIVAEAFAGGAP